MYKGGDTRLDSNDKKEDKKIILPKNLQREMMSFFIKKSIPKLVQKKNMNFPKSKKGKD